MVTKSWIREARKQGTLKITENWNCPYHNSERDPDPLMIINACKEHLWVSKKWFDSKFPELK